MTYDRYYSLISRVAKVRNTIRRHWLLFSVLFLMLLSAVFTLLYYCGSFIGSVSCGDINYGDVLQIEYDTFLSGVHMEFSTEGGEWSDTVPTLPGKYTVRVTTVNPLNIKRSQECSFEILKRTLFIKASDTAGVYGSIVYTLDSEGLADGDVIVDVTYNADKEPTENGTVEIGSVIIQNKNGEDVTAVYDITFSSGTLKIEKRPIVLSVKSAVKEYDSTPITPTEWYVAEGSLADGDHAKVSFEGSQTEIGTSDSVITSYSITGPDGRDMTHCYDVQTRSGAVTVEKIKLVLTTGSLTAEYDGDEKVCNTYELTSGKLFDKDSIFIRDSSHTEAIVFAPFKAGEYDNPFLKEESDVIIKDADGKDVTDRYSVSVVSGRITITKRKITVKTENIEVQYNGQNVTERGEIFVTEGFLIEDDYIAVIEDAETIINVGSIENKKTIVTINNAVWHQDVTDCYDITYYYGTVSVVKRKLTVKSPDLSKVYDGTPLSPEGGLVFVQGTLAELDRISCAYKNSITNVGSVVNECTILLSTQNPDVPSVSDNYDLTVLYGNLEIFPREITIKSPVSVFVYTGETFYTQDMLYLYDGSIAYGQRTSLLTKSSITEVGETENVFTVDILDSNGRSTAKNYVINYEYGALVVIPSLESSRMGRVDIMGEVPPSYNIEVPSLKNPDDIPPDDITPPDNNVDYVPPKPSGGEGNGNGNSNPDLPPTLEYPSKGEPGSENGNSNGGETSGGETNGNGSGGTIGTGNSSGGSGTEEPDPNTPVFFVKTEKKQTVFLRGRSYGDYTGSSWGEAVPYTGIASKSPLLYAAERLKAISGFNAKEYMIRIKGTTDFYTTYFSTSFSENMLSDVMGYTSSEEYSVFFYDFEETRELLYNSDALSNTEIDEYTKWVYEYYLNIDPSLKKQLIDIAAANGVYATSPTLLADVVYYLHSTTKYNLNYGEYPEGVDTIIYFLTTAKEGICTHYAGAAALLYRAYGIPARVVVGYKCQTNAGEWTPVTAPAHAWVEIYMDGVWYPIEATPSGSGSNLPFFEKDPLLNNHNVTPDNRPEIFVEFPSVQKYYDGKMLKTPEVKVSGDNLKKGHRVIATTNASITYVGSVKATVDSVKIVDENGNDVSNEYCIRIREGTFTVLPIKPVTVQKIIYMNSGDTFYPLKQILVDLYSGEEEKISTIPEFLVSSIRIEVSGVGVQKKNEGASATELGLVLSGTGKARIIFEIKDVDVNKDGVPEYCVDSTLSVTIEVKPFSNVRFRGISYIKAIENGSVDVSMMNKYVEYVDKNGNKYAYLAITTADVAKIFDGRPLSANDVTVLSGALLEGHVIKAKTSSERTYVGSAMNVCEELRILDVNGNDVTYMYAVDVFCGSLTVEPASVALPESFDITIDKDSAYDFSAVEWSQIVKNYPITLTVSDGEKFALPENGRIIGIKQGTATVEITFAAIDMNYDGILEYENTVYSFRVSVNDPELYKNTLVVVAVTAIAVVLVGGSLFMRVKRRRGSSDGENTGALSEEENEDTTPPSEETNN